MKLKSAIALLLISTMSYFGYGFVRTHTSGDVLAYKNFSRALMKGDRYAAQRMVVNPEVLTAFANQQERQAFYRGHVKFTYHQILEQHFSPDGQTVTLRVRQVTRLDPFNSDKTLLGSRSVEAIHDVKLEQQNMVWKLVRFNERLIGA